MKRPNEKDKIDQRLVDANTELVDRNKLLEEDKRILQNRINEAIKYIEEAYKEDEINVGTIYHEVYRDIEKILKGETDD